MGRPKGSKNKPKPRLPGYITEPDGRLNVRISASTRNSLAQLKEDFSLRSQEETLEKAVAIVMALREAVSK